MIFALSKQPHLPRAYLVRVPYSFSITVRTYFPNILFFLSYGQNLYSLNHFTIKVEEGITELGFNILIADCVAFTSNPLMEYISDVVLLEFQKGRILDR